MNLHDEISKVAYELYEKSGRVEGRDFENWLEAEKIVKQRYQEREIPEPELPDIEVENELNKNTNAENVKYYRCPNCGLTVQHYGKLLASSIICQKCKTEMTEG